MAVFYGKICIDNNLREENVFGRNPSQLTIDIPSKIEFFWKIIFVSNVHLL